MTPEERKSSENGIWLCQSCSKLIDTDTTRYSKAVLLEWKKAAELSALSEIEKISPIQSMEEDKAIIKFLIVQLFKMTFIRKVEWRILIKPSKILLSH